MCQNVNINALKTTDSIKFVFESISKPSETLFDQNLANKNRHIEKNPRKLQQL